MTVCLFGVIPTFDPTSLTFLDLPYIFFFVNGEILTKICPGLDAFFLPSNFNHVGIRPTDLSKNHHFKDSHISIQLSSYIFRYVYVINIHIIIHFLITTKAIYIRQSQHTYYVLHYVIRIYNFFRSRGRHHISLKINT
jgi:hypothetical protein